MEPVAPYCLKGKWALAQDADPARLTQTFDATNKTYETNVRCTQTQLLTSTKSYTRVPAKLGKALATENGTWQGVSYR